MKATGIRIFACALAAAFATQAYPAEGDEGWRWSLAPYLWASGIKETLRVDGEVVGGQDLTFADLVDKTEATAQLHFEGSRDRWGVFADLFYIELSDSGTGNLGVSRLDADIEEMTSEAGAIFRPGGRDGRFEVLLGVRHFQVDEDYRFQVGGMEPFDRSLDEDYLDGLVAVRYHIPLGERWRVSLKGDASFGDTDGIWTGQAMVAWLFGAKRGSAVYAGYRYRELEYAKGPFDVDRTLSGVGFGVQFGF